MLRQPFHKTLLLAVVVVFGLSATFVAAGEPKPGNIAPQARASASSTHPRYPLDRTRMLALRSRPTDQDGSGSKRNGPSEVARKRRRPRAPRNCQMTACNQ